MRLEKTDKHARDSEAIQITVLAADEQTRRIHAAVARRAFEIFQTRGAAAWHELEDWRNAERELLCNLCFGQTTIGSNVWLGTDASRFCEGTIGIWAAPRQLTIFGKPRVKKSPPPGNGKGNVHATPEAVFRVVALSNDIEPGTVAARVRGTALEITAKKADLGAAKELLAA